MIQNLIARIHWAWAQIGILVFDVKGDFTCVASLADPNIHVHRMREEGDPARSANGIQ